MSRNSDPIKNLLVPTHFYACRLTRRPPSSLGPPQVFNECDYTSRLLTDTVGIGRQTAIALSNAGWNVVLTARRLSALLETSELLRDPSACLTVAGDVSDEDFVKELFSSAIAEFGENSGCVNHGLMTYESDH